MLPDEYNRTLVPSAAGRTFDEASQIDAIDVFQNEEMSAAGLIAVVGVDDIGMI